MIWSLLKIEKAKYKPKPKREQRWEQDIKSSGTTSKQVLQAGELNKRSSKDALYLGPLPRKVHPWKLLCLFASIALCGELFIDEEKRFWRHCHSYCYCLCHCYWPLKVEIHRSTVSADGFHTKSIIEHQSWDSCQIFYLYSNVIVIVW